MKKRVVVRIRGCELIKVGVDKYEWYRRFGDVVVKKVK